MSLNPEEMQILESLNSKLKGHQGKNLEQEYYYEGKNKLKDFRISIPPQLATAEQVVGWPGTVVSVLEERLDLEGFIAPEALNVEEIYRSNNLDSEGSYGHTDAFIYGVGFIVIGKGEEGEPDPLITIESPNRMTAHYDLRLRRVSSALLMNYDVRGKAKSGVLYLPNETITVFNENGTWYDLDRDVHNLGRVPVVPLVNNPRSSDPNGRSEITRAVKSYTDSAMRTLLGAEIAREFYSAPQRYILGADESAFYDNDGNPLNPWSVYQGRILALPYNEQEGQMPQVGQFSANSTQPYFEQIRSLAQMLAAEAAIPPSYLGFQTDNPASADAIRQMESRLVKRAERRQAQFGRAWSEVMKIALLIRDGSIPTEANEIRPIWRDAATPTRAAAADEAVKLISAGVFLPDSQVTYNRIGLSDSDKQVLENEKIAARGSNLIQQLIAQPEAVEEAEEQEAVTDTFRDLSVGDVVRFSEGIGQIEHIMLSGILGIEGSEFAITATADNPAVQVRLWERVNGTWEATPVVYGSTYADVTRLDGLPE